MTCIVLSNNAKESFVLLFSPGKVNTVILMKEGKPIPEHKMLKLQTLDNLFPPLRHIC